MNNLKNKNIFNNFDFLRSNSTIKNIITISEKELLIFLLICRSVLMKIF